MSNSRKCTAIRMDGQPCQAWAIQGSQPALCFVHGSASWRSRTQKTTGDLIIVDSRSATHSCPKTLAEIAGYLRENADDSLDDELVVARLALKRLMGHLEERLSPHEFAHLAGVIFTGTNSIVRLLQAQRDLEKHSAKDFARAMNQALDELSEKMGVRL